jgi:NADP-dependent 3-hydroxy acid dehydrogenase YdfG
MAFPSPTKTWHTVAYPSIDPSLPALSSANKNIVISGGGSGMGPEIAKAFAQSGAASIALLGRTEATLLETKQQIEAKHPSTKVATYVADIISAPALEQALAAHAKAFGKLHVLVANAGYMASGRSIVDSDAEDWWKGFEVNVKGNFNLVRAFLPHAVSDAVVLNTNTAAAHAPYFAGMSGYSGSKMAGAKLFEYLHYEYPEMFVLNIQPGVIQTGMTAKAVEAGVDLPFDDGELDHAAYFNEAMLTSSVIVNLPASFMVWAASKEAKFLNGRFAWANWDVDELKAAAAEIEAGNRFTIGLLGWPQ